MADCEHCATLRAEVEKLNKSRNKWGQKYNKLLEQHKVTESILKAAVWSVSEQCKLLTAENEKLRKELDEAQREITQLYEDAAGESI
jgi:seryl-tRNA synthetase